MDICRKICRKFTIDFCFEKSKEPLFIDIDIDIDIVVELRRLEFSLFHSLIQYVKKKL